MLKLTEEQKKAYLEGGGGRCPACGSEDITGGSVEIEGGHAHQEVDCVDCDATWRDVYTLSGIQQDDEEPARGTAEWFRQLDNPF